MCATRNQREVPENFYRPDHGRTLNWYVRLVPPTPLRGLPGAKEFRKSTGTADLRKAKAIGARLIAEKRAEWQQLLDKAAGSKSPPLILSEELIKHICAQRLYRWMQMDDSVRFDGAGYDEESRARLMQVYQLEEKGMRTFIQKGKAASNWNRVLDVVDLWCDQLKISVDRADPLYPRLVRAFAEVELDAVNRLMRRHEGEPVPSPVKPEAMGARLSDVLEPYRAYKQEHVGPKHLGTSVNVWSKLIAHVGDQPISQISSADLFDFLEAGMRDGKKPWSMKYAHGLVKRTLREFFALARTRGMLTTGNPVDDMQVLPLLAAAEEKSRLKPRHPFTDPQLTTLFSSEWYKPKSTKWRGKMRKDLGARYWVPLVCLFHGNRVREVLQLVASDIGDADGVATVNLRAEIEGGQAQLAALGAQRRLKNESTQRIVPLHPALCEMGFLDFVQSRRKQDGDNAMLFPSSLPEAGGKSPMIGRAYEQAFLRFVRDELGFGAGFGNHSFRHQLEDRIRDAQRPGHQWPAGMAQGYTGRKRVRDKDVGRIETEGSEAAYGRGHSPALMREYIQSLDFSKVKLPPSFLAWLQER